VQRHREKSPHRGPFGWERLDVNNQAFYLFWVGPWNFCVGCILIRLYSNENFPHSRVIFYDTGEYLLCVCGGVFSGQRR